MKVEQCVRALAGTMVLVALLLSRVHHEAWLLLAGFVGANLLQSAFTGWCPAEKALQRLGCGR